MDKSILHNLYLKKYSKRKYLLKTACYQELIEYYHALLFPELSVHPINAEEDYLAIAEKLQAHLEKVLGNLKEVYELDFNIDKLVNDFFKRLEDIENELNEDAEFILANDPAAHSLAEVIACYPGFYAISIYRLAHFFYDKSPLLARYLTELSHAQTGVDIHPGAKIQSPFFIDHGTGIVIGETTEIGKRVKLYQGVTLGATSVNKDQKQKKRHPTIEDDCLIYANATILGGKTIIGKGSIIGGSVWITESVAEHSRVYYRPPKTEEI